jgi:hypothetical protein
MIFPRRPPSNPEVSAIGLPALSHRIVTCRSPEAAIFSPTPARPTFPIASSGRRTVPSIDFNDKELMQVYKAAFASVKCVVRTEQHLFMSTAPPAMVGGKPI